MAALVVPGAVLVRFVWALSGNPTAVNVLGGRKVTATTIDQGFANTLDAAIKSAFTASALKANVNSGFTLQSVGVRDISGPNFPEYMGVAAASPGTGATGQLPKQIAACATLRTAKAGKSFRGRYYQCGFDLSANTVNGEMQTTVGTNLVAWLEAVKTAMTSSGLALAVVSRLQVTATDVTTIQSRNNQWDTIRGRATPGI